MIISPDELFLLKEALWPDVTFYSKQVEVIESTVTNDETYVTAGNELGKDFVAGFIALGCFILCALRGISCRIVTTSVAEHHLKVLWGEIGRFAATAKVRLIHESEDKPGPLVINYQEIRRSEERAAKNPLNYLAGRVSAKGEGLAGHHAEFTMLLVDEASGVDDIAYQMGQGWMKHFLAIGNPNPCNNFFRQGVKGGDLLAKE